MIKRINGLSPPNHKGIDAVLTDDAYFEARRVE